MIYRPLSGDGTGHRTSSIHTLGLPYSDSQEIGSWRVYGSDVCPDEVVLGSIDGNPSLTMEMSFEDNSPRVTIGTLGTTNKKMGFDVNNS